MEAILKVKSCDATGINSSLKVFHQLPGVSKMRSVFVNFSRSPFKVVPLFSLCCISLMAAGQILRRGNGANNIDHIDHVAQVNKIISESGLSNVSLRVSQTQLRLGPETCCPDLPFASGYFWFHDVYYVRRNDLHNPAFSWMLFDDQMQVAKFSNYDTPYHWLEYQEKLKKAISSQTPVINMRNITAVSSSNIVMIQGWMTSYGHLSDSVLKLSAFFHYHALDRLGFVAAMTIPRSPWAENILEMARILFGEQHFINFEDVQPPSQLLKLEHVILVANWLDPNFMAFPPTSIQMLHAAWQSLLENITASKDVNATQSIFITRLHNKSHRLLKNLEEIEQFFLTRDFVVIEPEHLTNLELFHLIKDAKNIVMTNGSALATLLIFAQPTARVFILNAESYKGAFEKNIWRGALSRFSKVTYIESFQNEINGSQLLNIVNNLQY